MPFKNKAYFHTTLRKASKHTVEIIVTEDEGKGWSNLWNNQDISKRFDTSITSINSHQFNLVNTKRKRLLIFLFSILVFIFLYIFSVMNDQGNEGLILQNKNGRIILIIFLLLSFSQFHHFLLSSFETIWCQNCPPILSFVFRFLD